MTAHSVLTVRKADIMMKSHLRLAGGSRAGRGVSRRSWAAFVSLLLAVGMSSLGFAPAAAADPPGCQTADRYVDYGWAGKVRAVRVHLKARWCWDGKTVTATFPPEAYHTVTNLGSFYVDVQTDPIVESWEDPQNGGHWTRRIVLHGKIDVSVLKYGHIKTLPINLDLRLFGDGVMYFTRY